VTKKHTYGADFEEWWKIWPNPVGKLAAAKEYDRARARGATREELLAAVPAYVAHKPAYADFCHARTWLAQGRYLDEPRRVPGGASPAGRGISFTASELAQARRIRDNRFGCSHDPRCQDSGDCTRRIVLEELRGGSLSGR